MQYMYKDGEGVKVSDEDVESRRAEGWTDHPGDTPSTVEPEAEDEFEDMTAEEFEAKHADEFEDLVTPVYDVASTAPGPLTVEEEP